MDPRRSLVVSIDEWVRGRGTLPQRRSRDVGCDGDNEAEAGQEDGQHQAVSQPQAVAPALLGGRVPAAMRTPRGRMATSLTYRHFGLQSPAKLREQLDLMKDQT